jgi:hypothetical protein
MDSTQRPPTPRPEQSAGEILARRILARDDLLMTAADAESAIGIIRQNDRRSQASMGEPDVFALALERHLQGSQDSRSWAVRSQHLGLAGAVVRFCEMVGTHVSGDAAALFEQSLNELCEDGEVRGSMSTSSLRDRTLGVVTEYQAIRNLRLSGDIEQALERSQKDPEYFHGTGAEPFRFNIEFELGASLMMASNQAQVAAALGEVDERVAPNGPTRNRRTYALGLADVAMGRFEDAQVLFRSGVDQIRTTRRSIVEHDVQQLSITLAYADLAIVVAPSDAEASTGVCDLISEALSTLEGLRSRWRIISRSHSPLSVALRRMYGEVAMLVSRLVGNRAKKLGLQLALSAKQSGFAGLMRAGRSLVVPSMGNVVDDIVAYEAQLEKLDGESSAAASVFAQLDQRRRQLVKMVSPLLADFVLPEPVDVERLIGLIGDRDALDFVFLPDAEGRGHWFRTLIDSGGGVSFEEFAWGAGCEAFFRGPKRPLVGALDTELPDDAWIWRALAAELLPPRLLVALARANVAHPRTLLISPHTELSHVPWAALIIDGTGTRLVEKAVVAQSPILSCLCNHEVVGTEGPALVRLVGLDEQGVDVKLEERAWGISAAETSSRLDPPFGRLPEIAHAGEFAEKLKAKTGFGMVHIAAHGSNSGLGQTVRLPEKLTAGHALALKWPKSVLLAACSLGLWENLEEAEPLGFVVAVLAGGAECVVAALQSISDAGTGPIAAEIVRRLHPGIQLDVALREAQLANLEGRVFEWGLLSAFVR